jgi:hypothetical protein
MTATTGSNYNYVFDLAVQLSPEEQKRLVQELPNGTAPKPKEKFESFLPDPDEEEEPYDHEEFCQFILNGPVLSEEQIQRMLDAREEVNKWQPTDSEYFCI